MLQGQRGLRGQLDLLVVPEAPVRLDLKERRGSPVSRDQLALKVQLARLVPRE